MANPTVRNTFTGGMNKDALFSQRPNNTWSYGLNGIIGSRQSKGFGVSIEEGFEKRADVQGKILGLGMIESLNAILIFSEGDKISIYYTDTKETKLVATAAEFGCNWNFSDCEWIHPEFKITQPCSEVNVYWSSSCDYYTVNITEMLDPVRKEALKSSILAGNESETSCEYSCAHFKLMNCTCTPKLSPVVTKNGGNGIESGVYEFFVKLEDSRGNDTNWSQTGGPVYIGSENNIGGERSSSSIDLNITSLDCKYSVIKIAVRATVNGVSRLELMPDQGYNTNGITFKYYGQRGQALSLEEILIKEKKYIRGKELTQNDNRLWLYGIRQEKNPNMQRRVSATTRLSWKEFIVSAETAEKEQMTTYERNENYLPGIVYKYCDNTFSPTFLITSPGEGSGSSSLGTFTPPSGDAELYERIRGNTQNGTILENREGDTETPGNEVDSWGTTIDNWEESAKCDDCQEPFCCDDNDPPQVVLGETSSNCEGCDEDEIAIHTDGPKYELTMAQQMNVLAQKNEDKVNPDKNIFTTIREAAKNLIDKVRNSESVKRTKSNFTIVNKISGGIGNSPGSSPQDAPDTGVGIPSTQTRWGDSFHDGKGQPVITGKIIEGNTFAPIMSTSTNKYPMTKDCEGEYVYGTLAGQDIRLFGTPTGAQSPITTPTAAGVPTRSSPNVDPIYSNNVNLLGIVVTGVPLPENEEQAKEWFPKPLCPNEPYRVVMVERNHANSTCQAKGILTGMFTGMSNGETYAFGRLGVNSRAEIDRFIDNGGSHLGDGNADGMYVFHGLDTDIGKVGLSGETIMVENMLNGFGHRYGLYSKGKDPVDKIAGRRIDQRGARSYVNLNLPAAGANTQDITAMTYVAADSVVSSAIAGMAYNIGNRQRESCVVIQAGGDLGIEVDSSFIPDGFDHEAPVIGVNAAYGTIKKTIPDQYGAVQSAMFVDTGIAANGYTTSVKGIGGDTFIGQYSYKRPSYVSDKVGNKFPTDGERERTVCDIPDDLLLQDLGINAYPTRLPKSGDIADAKNWANPYENAKWNVAAASWAPKNDFYYPKVQKTLITTWVESRINPWKRATAAGDQKTSGSVFYPKLKDLYLDSNEAGTHPWEESYIPRYYYEVVQPSQSQLLRKAMLRNLVEIIIPAAGAFSLTQLEGVIDTTGFFFALPALIAYWITSKELLTRDDYLNRIVGIADCKTDDEGSEPDNNVVNFEDNYYDYNWDYSVVYPQDRYPAMPLVYNTCACDDCEGGQTTNETFFSHTQIEGSSIDSYKNFKAFSFLNIPADSGRLKLMYNFGGNFYAQTTDALFLIKYGAVTTQTSLGAVLLGGNEIVANPNRFMQGVREGFAGLQDPNAYAITPYGVFFVDNEANKFYQFNGQQAKEISMVSLDNFFADNIDFCEKDACHGEKVEGKTYYSIGYDPRYNRILFTKSAKAQNNMIGAEDISNQSFTVSYYPEQTNEGRWAFFHSYVPQAYINDRKTLYSTSGGCLYEHNIKDSYLKFYDGEKSPFEIELTAVADEEWFTYINTTMDTSARKGNVKDLDVTFNKVAIWNNTQGTGTKDFKLKTDNMGGHSNAPMSITNDGKVLLSKIRRKYVFNNSVDLVKPTCSGKELILMHPCNPIESINEEVFDCTRKQQNFQGANLKDDHLTYRLTYNPQDNETQLNLLSVVTEITRDKV